MFAPWESNFLMIIGKIFFMVISVVYMIFAFIVVRQVGLMNKSFTTSLHGFFTFMAWVHFFASILAVVLVFLVL